MKENLVETEFKHTFGEINSPFKLADEMISMFPTELLANPELQWLDPGCGQGNLTFRLFDKLSHNISDKKHIIERMLHVIELNNEREPDITAMFHECCPDAKPNITINDVFAVQSHPIYDSIICNPPFNVSGKIKTPTTTSYDKLNDGFTVWCEFVRHCMSLLKDGGYMCFIVPAIWMKPDKAGMYEFLLKWKIERIKCYTNTETNTIFAGQAQTPTSIFLLRKLCPINNLLSIYSNKSNKYISYNILQPASPIPMTNIELVNELQPHIAIHGHIKVTKTNMPIKRITFLSEKTPTHPYKNIRTTKLTSKIDFNKAKLDDNDTIHVIEWSNEPCVGYNTGPKIIMAHKMYGMPFIDYTGDIGISNRDSYIIDGVSIEELERTFELLNNTNIIKVYDATRYRMKYLEKYAFELIPNITSAQLDECLKNI